MLRGLKTKEGRVLGRCLVEYEILCRHWRCVQMRVEYGPVMLSGGWPGGLCSRRARHGEELRRSGWPPQLGMEVSYLLRNIFFVQGVCGTYFAENATRRAAFAFSAWKASRASHLRAGG